MSCLNYFSKTSTDRYNCNNTNASGNLPSHELTSQEKQCMGIGVNMDEWGTFWKSGTCQSMYKEMIKPNGTYSEVGFTNAVADYNYIFYSYFGPYDPNTNPNGGHQIDEKDEMSNLLIESCSQNQGVCQCVAYNMCSNCKSYEVYEDGLIKKLCGCACQNTVSQVYGIDPYCEPPCASRETSKHRNFTTGRIDFCHSKVCFVDEPEVFLFDSECPHCSNNDCDCVSDKPLTSALKKKCSKYNIVREPVEPESTFSYSYFVFILVVVLLVLISIVENSNEESTEISNRIETKVSVPVKNSEPIVAPISKQKSKTVEPHKKTVEDKTQTYDYRKSKTIKPVYYEPKQRHELPKQSYYTPKQLYSVDGSKIQPIVVA